MLGALVRPAGRAGLAMGRLPQGHRLYRTGETGTLGDAYSAARCELVLGTLDGVFAKAGSGVTGHCADCLA